MAGSNIAPWFKVNGHWVKVQRPYIKKNEVWTGVKQAWVKESGVWKLGYEYDVIPPNPPEITLSIVEDSAVIKGVKTLTARWIRVGTRLPGAQNDDDAKLIRILTTYAGKPPTTPLGGTYTSEADNTWPKEAWSDWRYNDYGEHDSTAEYSYKQWPLNASGGKIIGDDKTYYFGGWSQDNNGNWSVPVQASIHIPKTRINMADIVVKEARFQPNSSGSWSKTGYQSGDLIQAGSPRSQGLWFYGSQITDSVGAQTTQDEKVTVRSAQIYVQRGSDTGVANANIYLFWTSYAFPAGLPNTVTAPIQINDCTKLGTLAQGQAKWFDLPNSFNADLNKNIKGMGLHYQDPNKASPFPEDFSTVVSTGTNLRCGEVHIVWEEEL